MKRLTLLFVLSILLIGCADANGESQTLFGALSARFQLGSTEETLFYKKIADPYLITAKGEVLENKGSAMNFSVAGLDEPVDPADLTLTFTACITDTITDDNRWDEPNSCEKIGLIRHTIATEFNASDQLFYTVDNDIIYHDFGDWLGEVVIENAADGSEIKVPFELEVYEARPPTTTAFELTNLLLPFAVIGLFLLIGRLRHKPFITPLNEVSV